MGIPLSKEMIRGREPENRRASQRPMFFPFRDHNPSRRTPVVTYGLVAVNVLAFLWLNLLPDREQQRVVMVRGFVPARIGQLVQPRLLEIEVPREQMQTPMGVMVRVDR